MGQAKGVVKVSRKGTVIVLEVNVKRNRISLSMKTKYMRV